MKIWGFKFENKIKNDLDNDYKHLIEPYDRTRPDRNCGQTIG